MERRHRPQIIERPRPIIAVRSAVERVERSDIVAFARGRIAGSLGPLETRSSRGQLGGRGHCPERAVERHRIAPVAHRAARVGGRGRVEALLGLFVLERMQPRDAAAEMLLRGRCARRLERDGTELRRAMLVRLKGRGGKSDDEDGGESSRHGHASTPNPSTAAACRRRRAATSPGRFGRLARFLLG